MVYHLQLSTYVYNLRVLNIDDMYDARQTYPEQAPLWLVGLYSTANLFLNTLNLYWFSKMIDSLRRRAEAKPSNDDHTD